MSGFKWNGGDPRKALRAFQRRVEQKEGAALDAIAILLERTLKVEVSTPGRGRTYRLARVSRNGLRQRTKRGVRTYIMHRASAPGDPPTVNLGSYRNSIGWRRMSLTTRRVGTDDQRGKWFEDGTPHMAKRPHFEPALKKIEKEMGKIITDHLRGA